MCIHNPSVGAPPCDHNMSSVRWMCLNVSMWGTHNILYMLIELMYVKFFYQNQKTNHIHVYKIVVQNMMLQ